MTPSTSTRNTFILLFYLTLTILHVKVIGYNGCYQQSKQGITRCKRCTQECSEARNEVEVTPCTQKSNRSCFCKPGFYCTRGNNYVTHCHKPCVPCGNGTFSSNASLGVCKPHKDCAQSGMEMINEGTVIKDRECAFITTAMSSLPTSTNIITTFPTTNTSIPGTGLLKGEHEHYQHRSQSASDHQISSNSQSHTEIPLGSDGREVKGQSTGLQQVTMDHNGKGENISNTVGSIYIYSPGMVILGSNSGDKKEEAGVCEEGVPLISRPQQESNPPSQEVRIRISAQEEAKEELSLSFPVPATGK
ncbi:uncharacterized protein si:dkeyp-61b2.1 isoform X2 [Onychostoma macrolepis]|uniref:uncharacterized protein si:dkeyp-61b2.1 isoform X2 n=1 Tax=Onychostoma macrolepis TaxID=369639 RepID=UPI00272A2EF6|nr:uncharacterized protein si:dkeyp-61b2.1 isoform X2 [Onychostoma macrolepis]